MIALNNLRAYIGMFAEYARVKRRQILAALRAASLKLRWIGLTGAVMLTRLNNTESWPFQKKERGQSPARKIVSTLFPRKM
jgi:hypothetical protein